MSENANDFEARLAAAGQRKDSLDERQREASIHAQLFGESAPVYLGRYRVGERLGAGAMGTVFAAHDESLDRAVAIKVLRDRGEGAEARMLREARALARLSHPNVVTVHEVGTDADRTFVVMEFVPGKTLADWQPGRPWRAVVHAYIEAGRGLAAVHAAGLVHRDFKPSNVLVGSDGRVRVADFGLVRAVDSEEVPAARIALNPGLTQTATGALVGTPAYMAPEQIRGKSVGKHSDLFAFCASLYEALAGRRPFVGEGVEGTLALIAQGPAPIPQRAVGEVLARGLAEDPALRWASMADLLEALQVATRRRSPRLMGAAAGVLAITAGAWALWPAPPSEAEPASPALPAVLRQRPELVARLLAVRSPANKAWREAALEVLKDPITDRLIEPGRGPISDVRLVGGDDLLLWTVDGKAFRWAAGTLVPWSAVKVAPPCRPPGVTDGPPWPASWVAEAEVGAIGCRPDGLLALVGGAATLYPFEGPPERWRSLPAGTHQLAPGSAGVVTTTPDGDVLLTPLDTEEPPMPINGLNGVLRTAANADLVAFSQTDGQIMTWQPGGRPRRVTRLDRPAGGLLMSPDGQWLLAWVEGRARIWDLKGGGDPVQLPGTWRLALGGFDDTGRWLALVAADGKATLWDMLNDAAHPLVGHGGGVSNVLFLQGKLVTSGSDGGIRIWSLEGIEGELVGRHTAAIWSGRLDRERRRLVTAGVEGTAWIWPLAGGKPVALQGHTRPIFTAVFSPDGQRVATACGDGSARVWSTAGDALGGLPGHEGWAYALDYSSDGRLLATSSREGVVRLWPQDGSDARVLGDHGGPEYSQRVHEVAFSPDDRWVASACKSGDIRLWPVAGGAPRILPRHAGNASVYYLSTGELVTMGADSEIRILTPAGDRILRVLGGHETPVVIAVPSADARWLAVSLRNGAVLVWSLTDPDAPPQPVGSHTGVPEFLAFDARAERLLVGTSTGELRLWTLASGPPRTLAGHRGGVRFVGFDHEDVPISAGSDGAVRRWPVADDEATLRARLARATEVCPSAEERAKWFRPEEAAALACAAPVAGGSE